MPIDRRNHPPVDGVDAGAERSHSDGKRERIPGDSRGSSDVVSNTASVDDLDGRYAGIGPLGKRELDGDGRVAERCALERIGKAKPAMGEDAAGCYRRQERYKNRKPPHLSALPGSLHTDRR
jgi:hypothetical protein